MSNKNYEKILQKTYVLSIERELICNFRAQRKMPGGLKGYVPLV
jgi:hypothetical protein